MGLKIEVLARWPEFVIREVFGDKQVKRLNIDALKKNVGWWVRFRPEARGLTISDAEWFIESVDVQSK